MAYSPFLPVVEPLPEIVKTVQDQLALLGEERANLETQINNDQASSLAFKARLEEIDSERLHLIRRITPYYPSRLPLEVIREIFSHYILDDCDPWILTHICRAWRDFAFEAFELWRRIEIRTFPIDKSTRNSYQQCDNQTRLKRSLSRARYSSLDLRLFIPDSKGLEGNSEFWRMMDLVGDEKLRSWKRVTFPFGMSECNLWQAYFQTPHASLVNLEVIHLTGQPLSPLVNLLNRSSIRLKELHVDECNHHEMLAYKGPWLQSITYLDIGLYDCTVLELERLLTKFPSLLSFSVYNASDYRAPSEEGSEETILPKLQYLWLHTSRHKCLYLMASTLVNLTIEVHHPPGLSRSSTELPNLQYLEALRHGSLYILANLVCPKLNKLVLKNGHHALLVRDGMGILHTNMMEKKCLIDPIEIEFNAWGYCAKELKEVLGEMKRLRRLLVQESVYPESFWQFMNQFKGGSTSGVTVFGENSSSNMRCEWSLDTAPVA